MRDRPGPPPLAAGAEFDLIRRILDGLPPPGPGVRVGPGDDCAVVTGEGIALSADVSVEGVHFRRDWLSMREIGHRAAAGALSDLAAVAARPIGALVSLVLPPRDAGANAEALMAGVRDALAAVGGALLGGDVSRTDGPLVIDVTVVGEAARPVLRSGARPGDEVWVTGELGGPAAALAALLRGDAPDPAARARFATPRPRVAEAAWLREHASPTAMIDLSDGLAGDAAHLAAASGAAFLLVPDLLPVHPAARAAGDAAALRLALSGGEDYELCLTAPAGVVGPLVGAFTAATGTALTAVGRVGRGDGVWRVDAEGRRAPLDAGGWQHFGGKAAP